MDLLRNNTHLVIDPPTCGCTECITGKYHPQTDEVMEEAARLAFEESVEVYNNTYISFILIAYNNGSFSYQDVSGVREEYDTEVIDGFLQPIVMLALMKAYNEEGDPKELTAFISATYESVDSIQVEFFRDVKEIKFVSRD